MERQVIKADVLGFCMGVRRAVNAVNQALKEYNDKRIYTLGPLIHNDYVLSNFKKQGIEVINENEIDKFKIDCDCVVVIRAHGVTPSVCEKLKKTGCIVIDATCPRVLANQKKALDYARQGFTVIIAGDKKHGEVTALQGVVENASSKCVIIANEREAEELDSVPENTVFISQTTISQNEYDSISKILQKKQPTLKILHTICPATAERQQSLIDLCSSAESIVVIGGKNSANTQRLYATAKSLKPFSIYIESPDEIPDDFLKFERIGITAGASTPDSLIEAVENRLKSK